MADGGGSDGASDAPAAPAQRPPAEVLGQEPFRYRLAANLHCVLHLSREAQLRIWRHALDGYAEASRPIPRPLQELCEPAFIENLLADEVFWGMVGNGVSRQFYAEATVYLPAVFATAALLAARQDGLTLPSESLALLTPPPRRPD